MRNEKAWRSRAAIVLLVVLLGAGPSGCAFNWKNDSPRRSQSVATAEAPGEEEVLDADDDFGTSPSGPTGTAGEILVVFGYVGMILASAVLPLLLLL